jgi:hypothetical protein
LRNAIKAFNPNSKVEFSAPMTPEKVLIGLHGNIFENYAVQQQQEVAAKKAG